VAWAKVDDGWFAHRKVVQISLAARGLWTTVLSWSCAERTSYVPGHMARFLAVDQEIEGLAAELVSAGMWHVTDGGWTIHDWSKLFRVDRRPHATDDDRLELWLRDGWGCANCLAKCGDLQVDHIIPLSRGGTHSLDNMQWLCGWCNVRKSDLMPNEWEAIRSDVSDASPCSDWVWRSGTARELLEQDFGLKQCPHDPDPIQKRIARRA
jgi:hypothetical protein